MDNKKIGAFIGGLRKEKNMNQSELAERLGVTNKAVSKWECGDGYPEITLIPSIASELGVTVDELLNGERSINAPNLKTTYSDALISNSMNKYKKFSYISLGITTFGILDLVVARSFEYLLQKEIFIFIAILIFSLCLITSIVLYCIHYNEIKNRLIKYSDNCRKDEYYEMVKSVFKIHSIVVWSWIVTVAILLSQIMLIALFKSIGIIIYNAITLFMLLTLALLASFILTRYKLKQIDFYGIDKSNLHQRYKKWLLNGVNAIALMSGVGVSLCGIFINYIYHIRIFRLLYNPLIILLAAIICTGSLITSIILNVTRYKLK